jgi:hypothetical protein
VERSWATEWREGSWATECWLGLAAGFRPAGRGRKEWAGCEEKRKEFFIFLLWLKNLSGSKEI